MHNLLKFVGNALNSLERGEYSKKYFNKKGLLKRMGKQLLLI